MFTISIPGREKVSIEHIILDYHGTLAIDGKMIDGVKEKLVQLSQSFHIHVITADTFGACGEQLQGLNCSIQILEADNQSKQKESYLKEVCKKNIIAIGNGANDSLMLKCADIGIALIQQEGVAIETLLSSDIVCNHIHDALDLMTNPKRLIATMRV